MRPLNLLAFETSCRVLTVALKKGKQPIAEEKLEGYFRHAENLLPLTGRLLDQAGLAIEDIDVFLIGRGPGSFTGLRIAFSTLKGLLAVEKKDCYGVLSLDIIAFRTPSREGSPLCVCLDARREKIYTRFYREKEGLRHPDGPADLLSPEELIEKLPERSCLAGDAIRRYGKDFLECGKNLTLLDEQYWYPQASSLIELFEEEAGRKKTFEILRKLENPEDFVPLYFRASQAEEKRKEHAPNH